jgi:hypothetical protein
MIKVRTPTLAAVLSVHEDGKSVRFLGSGYGRGADDAGGLATAIGNLFCVIGTRAPIPSLPRPRGRHVRARTTSTFGVRLGQAVTVYGETAGSCGTAWRGHF